MEIFDSMLECCWEMFYDGYEPRVSGVLDQRCAKTMVVWVIVDFAEQDDDRGC